MFQKDDLVQLKAMPEKQFFVLRVFDTPSGKQVALAIGKGERVHCYRYFNELSLVAKRRPVGKEWVGKTVRLYGDEIYPILGYLDTEAAIEEWGKPVVILKDQVRFGNLIPAFEEELKEIV